MLAQYFAWGPPFTFSLESYGSFNPLCRCLCRQKPKRSHHVSKLWYLTCPSYMAGAWQCCLGWNHGGPALTSRDMHLSFGVFCFPSKLRSQLDFQLEFVKYGHAHVSKKMSSWLCSQLPWIGALVVCGASPALSARLRCWSAVLRSCTVDGWTSESKAVVPSYTVIFAISCCQRPRPDNWDLVFFKQIEDFFEFVDSSLQSTRRFQWVAHSFTQHPSKSTGSNAGL